jgi:flavodoxin
MNIKVMYHTTTGNTRKVAEAIAAAVGAEAEAIEGKLSSSAAIDLLFVGDGIYGGKPHKKTTEFIAGLKPDIVKNAVVFATYGGQDHIGATIQKQLAQKGINVLNEPFLCKGKCWLLINRKHPDQADLDRARAFAKAVQEQLCDDSLTANG